MLIPESFILVIYITLYWESGFHKMELCLIDKQVVRKYTVNLTLISNKIIILI